MLTGQSGRGIQHAQGRLAAWLLLPGVSGGAETLASLPDGVRIRHQISWHPLMLGSWGLLPWTLFPGWVRPGSLAELAPTVGGGPPHPPTGLECGSRTLLVPTPWLYCRRQPAGPLNTMCKSPLFLFPALSVAGRLGWECGPVNRRGICSLQMKQAPSPP